MTTTKQVLAAASGAELIGKVEELLLETGAAGFQRVGDGEAALSLALRREFALIVTEIPLPELELEDFLRRLRAPGSPSADSVVVVMAGSLDRDALEALGPERLPGVEICTNSRQTLRAVTRKLRISDRIEATVGVRITASTESFSGTQVTRTRNISTSGLLLGAEHLLPVGLVTPIAIELHDGEPMIHGRAEVVRHTDPEREDVVGMGMRFVRLFADGGERLSEFVYDGLDSGRGLPAHSA